jgi:hypothetical protein
VEVAFVLYLLLLFLPLLSSFFFNKVGLTRAVRRMNVYYHPRMPAAPEHDPKPGANIPTLLLTHLF